MDSTTAAVVEVERVQHHIARAATQAARRDTSGMSRVQRIVRRLLLRALDAYRADGRFPINRDFASQTPYFVDAGGTRCAMAHLLELGGERDLVAKIARERNNAYVRELADEPRLLAWLRAAGLSVDEAAAIQPAYCSETTSCICGGDFSYVDYPVPALGVLEGVVQPNGMARVERTYGDAFGIAVGSDIQLAATYPEGTRILAPIDSADAPQYGFGAIDLDADSVYECTSQGVSSAPPLDGSDFITAVLANDCEAALHDVDDAWAREPDCDGGGIGPGPRGCSSSDGGAAFGVGILLALVGVMARRR